ncbi:M20 aminoacylase family protein [Tepidiphilus baoligensis]|uniref:Amidohydrolase n=1 Tax=Tepidiphilus baoligensis TaxID=2698687 RepID=A0ABX1QPC6_9PROT|nr:M20 aminoacylase family protein [Tepidiphilus baoligensis]NMH17459.1 amidohydrolase [Tepidiphilus baoligensis]
MEARRWLVRAQSRERVWREWRHELHAHPELAYEERRTAAFVAERLRSFGLDPVEGLAETGVVAVLEGRRGEGPMIALRADMDALPIPEANTFAHASREPGKMHACGHDGHTAMLLAAAELLAADPAFAGTVVFVFQPAEEGGGGAKRMVEEGFFERYPVREIYGMHNWPGLPVGQFAVHSGPVMAGTERFRIVLRGRGTHAAMPHLGDDVIAAGAALVQSLQTVVSRRVDPLQAAVLSVTQFHAGHAFNVIPAEAELAGTVRAFSPELFSRIGEAIERIGQGVASAYGLSLDVEWDEGYPPTINTASAAARCAEAAVALVGAQNVCREAPPSMGAEDFAFFLQHRPGAYVWIGNGPGEGGCLLHSPHYDFNDELLSLGAAYWATLVTHVLSA